MLFPQCTEAKRRQSYFTIKNVCVKAMNHKKKNNFELKGLVPMKKPTLWELTKEGTFFQLRET